MAVAGFEGRTVLLPFCVVGRRAWRRWTTAAVSAVPRTEGDAGFRRMATGWATCFTAVLLACPSVLGRENLALFTGCFPFETATLAPEDLLAPEVPREGRGPLVAVVAVAVTPPEALQIGCLNGVEAPTGILRVGIGSIEAAPPGNFGGGTGILGRELPVAVAPKLAAHPPKICLLGTGSLDFQALAPVPEVLPVGGGAAAPPFPEVPANLSAAGVVGEDLPAAAAIAMFLGRRVLFVAPKLAARPPRICLVGTGSLDSQALAPVPEVLPVGGSAAAFPFPGVPANLLAVGVVGQDLPAAVTAEIEAVVIAMFLCKKSIV